MLKTLSADKMPRLAPALNPTRAKKRKVRVSALKNNDSGIGVQNMKYQPHSLLWVVGNRGIQRASMWIPFSSDIFSDLNS
jgi:hypothetical protein